MIVWSVSDPLDEWGGMEGEIYFPTRKEAEECYRDLKYAELFRVVIPDRLTKQLAVALLNRQSFQVESKTIKEKQTNRRSP